MNLVSWYVKVAVVAGASLAVASMSCGGVVVDGSGGCSADAGMPVPVDAAPDVAAEADASDDSADGDASLPYCGDGATCTDVTGVICPEGTPCGHGGECHHGVCGAAP